MEAKKKQPPRKGPKTAPAKKAKGASRRAGPKMPGIPAFMQGEGYAFGAPNSYED
jgi:hypothetical protein